MNNNFYKLILEESLSAYAYQRVICDEKGVPNDFEFIEVNSAFEKLMGLEGKNLIGKRMTEIAPAITERLMERIRLYGEVAISGEKRQVDYYSETFKRFYRVNIFSPKKYYFVCRFNDIAKENSEEKYEKLWTLCSDSLFLIDMETGDILDVNEVACFNYGYTYNELINLKNTDLSAEPLQTLQKTKDFQELIPLRYHKKKDCTVFPVEITSSMFVQNQRKVVLAAIRDITEREKAHEEIICSKEYFELMFNISPDASMITNISNGLIINVNDGFVNISGYTREDVIGKTSLELNLYQNSDDRKKIVDELKENGHCKSAEAIFICKDNSTFIGLMSAKVAEYNGKVNIVSTIRNISNSRLMEQELSISNEKQIAIFNQSPIVIEFYDADGFLISANDAYFELFGIINRNEVLGFKLFADPNINEEMKQKVLNCESVRFETKFDFEEVKKLELYGTTRSGFIYLDMSISPLLNNQKLAGYIVQIQDITEQKRKEAELLYNANHDCLTGLNNRRRFEEVLNQIEKSGEIPVSIAVGDVNNLKLINDGYGYYSGDTVLKKIAEIIKKVCNKHSHLARIGGDEFSLIFLYTSYEEANEKVKQIKLCCAEESLDELMLSITFGVVTKTSKGQSLMQCQHLAEERMHTSKLLDSKNIRSIIIENLRMVLEEKTGETRNHCERMAEMSRFIGANMGMQEYEIEKLTLLALLHDIGKTAISESILLQTGKLDESQFKIMQKHSEIGYRIAKTMPELLPIAEGILYHHERYDGGGYPQGLTGVNIPLISRIVAVLDAYDAMTNDRPYRKAMSKTESIEEIKRCSGTQFDPEIAKVFLDFVVEGLSINIIS